MSDSQLVEPPSGDSSNMLLGAGAADEGLGGSAVDLGSRGMVDLPFPLGVDSTVGSRIGSGRKPAAPASAVDPDSGTVDLLAGGDEFDLGLVEPATSPSWAAAREDLPPTVPMVPAGKGRLMAWAGGGAGGVLAGVALCAGLWFAGLVPNQSAKSTTGTTPAANPQQSDTAGLSAQVLQAMTTQRDDEAKKAAAATADAQQAKNQLAQMTVDLSKAKAAATQAKQAEDRAAALAAQVKQAEAAQTGLKESVDLLTAGKASADAKIREADAALAEIRTRLNAANAAATAAKEKAESAEATAKQSATLAADLAQRLRVAPNASPAEFLAALDRELARPATEPPPAFPSRPATSAVLTPEQARQTVNAGFQAYRTSNYSAAERDFDRLATSPEANAIHWYYLGLSQWKQGRAADAEKSFGRGWALELNSRPPPGQVQAAFERLDRADREAVNRFRR